MNTFKTALLLTALTLCLMLLGEHYGGRNGMILAFAIAAGINFFSYFYSDKLALTMYRAQPVSREDILNKIWGIEANPTNRTIDNFVVKLRKKLERQADKPKHILTVYGYGYKLVP